MNPPPSLRATARRLLPVVVCGSLAVPLLLALPYADQPAGAIRQVLRAGSGLLPRAAPAAPPAGEPAAPPRSEPAIASEPRWGGSGYVPPYYHREMQSLREEVAEARKEIAALRGSLAELQQLRTDVQALQRQAQRSSRSLTERDLQALLMKPEFLMESFLTEEFMDIHDALNLELIESLHPHVFRWDPLETLDASAPAQMGAPPVPLGN